MRTVPLHGKKAADRVALVDDEDYDLVMRYRWNVTEKSESGKRRMGPYAVTKVPVSGGPYRQVTLQMHVLIMGIKGVDHIDHDGLNNQRYNLRPATQVQNGGNQRPQTGKTSAYKGVHWSKERKLWRASIRLNKKLVYLGESTSELEAAYVYDAAAREAFGEYAYPNFPEGPTPEAVEQWRAERAEYEAGRSHRIGEARSAAWTRQEAVACICQECGKEYFAKMPGRSRFCGGTCIDRARRRREREKRQQNAA